MTYGPLAYGVSWVAVLIGLFVLIVGSLEVGRLLGRARMKVDESGGRKGLGPIEAALFALLGLLIAFSFSGAIGRFEARRQFVVDEATALGSAYRRIDLMTAASQPPERDLLRRYLSARIQAYQAIPDVALARTHFAQAVALRPGIWAGAVAGCKHEPTSCATLVFPALDRVFELAEQRTTALGFHPPGIVFGMLVIIAMLCAMMAGYASAEAPQRNWFYLVCFAAVIAMTIYVILEIEYPRAGFMRLDLHDELLKQALDSMR